HPRTTRLFSLAITEFASANLQCMQFPPRSCAHIGIIMKLANSLFLNISVCTMFSLAGLGFGIAKPASGAEWNDIENFSMSGFIAGQTVQLLENVVALGAEQASFQAQLDSARNALERGWSDPIQRDQAARRLAELL